MSGPVGEFLEMIRIGGSKAEDISAVVLVGSHARGESRSDSDIDLVIIAESPGKFLFERS